jgi:hypothetical protein
MTRAHVEFESMVLRAEQDPAIVGVVLGGSRGKNAYVSEASDYDVYVIFRDADTRDRFTEEFPSVHGDPVEVIPLTLGEFREHALPGSPTAWNAYTFAHVSPLVDKLDGEIAGIAATKESVDPAAGAGHLDSYINSSYRAAKNVRDGLHLEGHLDSTEGMSALLDFLFCAYGRVRPYNKWLPWELENHPLPEPWTARVFLPRVQRILAIGEVRVQQSVFRDVERLARNKGYGTIVDGWQPDLSWLRGAKS